MDGVLSDFAGAFREVELRLFGPSAPLTVEPPEIQAEQDEKSASASAGDHSAREMRRRRDAIWAAIRETPDFWRTLRPLDALAIPRIYDLMIRGGWEVFFITHRPATAGETVQRQTQLWLRDQGFDLPSVLVISGSRAAAAGALRLSYHVDDNPQNCLDVASALTARPILIAPERDEITENSARRLRISVARNIGEALDILAAAAPDFAGANS